MNDRASAGDRIKLARYREASEWLLTLNAAGADEAEAERWLRWCQADPENLAAFEKLQQDWQDTEGFKSAPELLNAVPAASRSHDHDSLRLTPQSWGRFPVRWAVAAGVIVGAIAVLQPWKPAPVHEVLAATRQEPAMLPDGSSLLLSAKATAEVDFSGISRHVALRPNSEAFIKVHHDVARPFTVRAGAMTVTAVGTAFDVRREADHVVVTVEEGVIVASASGPDGPNEWRAGAGYQVDYSGASKTAVVSRVDAEHVLRWRDGELAYDDAPLGTVIADINRYSNVNVVVRDPALTRLRFTGTVFVASVNDWIKALEVKYPVHASMSPEGDIGLEPSASSTGATH